MGKEICVCKKNGTRICERGFCKKGRSSIMYRETMEKLISLIQIFSTGRSLNFIRYSCHDSDWIETQAKIANAGRGESTE